MSGLLAAGVILTLKWSYLYVSMENQIVKLYITSLKKKNYGVHSKNNLLFWRHCWSLVLMELHCEPQTLPQLEEAAAGHLCRGARDTPAFFCSLSALYSSCSRMYRITLSGTRYLTLWPRRSARRTCVAEMSLVTHSCTTWIPLRWLQITSDCSTDLKGSLPQRVMHTSPKRPIISARSSCFHRLGTVKDSRTSAPHSSIIWGPSGHEGERGKFNQKGRTRRRRKVRPLKKYTKSPFKPTTLPHPWSTCITVWMLSSATCKIWHSVRPSTKTMQL